MKTQLKIAFAVITLVACIAGAVSLVLDPPAPPEGTSYLPNRPRVDSMTDEPRQLELLVDDRDTPAPD